MWVLWVLLWETIDAIVGFVYNIVGNPETGVYSWGDHYNHRLTRRIGIFTL